MTSTPVRHTGEGSSPPVGTFADPLAGWLWEARRTGHPAPPAAQWPELTATRAAALAEQLYDRVVAEGDRRTGWKFGAFGSAAQRAFGIDGPVVAPTMSSWTWTGATSYELDLSGLVSPRLEAEVGVYVDGGGDRWLVPCVEVADCRFPAWDLPPRGVIADFGLQGAMVYGQPVRPVSEVSVAVHHRGKRLQGGAARWASVVESLDLVPSEAVLDGGSYIATGSITAPLPVRRGPWTFDFGRVGSLVLDLRGVS